MQDWFYIHKEVGLCLTFKAMIACGVSEDTLSMASRRETRSWAMIEHPERKRSKLIVWLKLRECYKEKVVKHIGDPIEYMAKQPIRDLIQTDYKGEAYYMKMYISMRISNPHEAANKSLKAASALNTYIKLKNDTQFLKKVLNIPSKEAFTIQFCSIIESDGIDLPTSKRPLEKRALQYQREGYECLISGKYGNKNSAKIGKGEFGFDSEIAEMQIALIRTAKRKHNNFNTVQITNAVNAIFQDKELPVLSRGTIDSILQANKHLTISGSGGKRVYNNEIAMQVKRSRPKIPLQYFTLDGWTVELAFMDEDGKVKRLVVVIVIDVMNNYPVGYAIGDRESAELIRQANRNALIHIKELFGETYRPWQIQSDHFALKANTPFFKAMAHLHTPAAIGNAKSKVIEPYFMYLNKHYCQTQYNWTGFNIDAKKSNQVNREFSDKIKNQFPAKEGVIKQIDAIILQERKLKGEQYLQAWQDVPESEKSVLDRMDSLMVFGKTTGYTNSLTGMGLMPTIEGNQHIYDSFNPAFRALQHLNWQVVYDEYDLSNVVVVSEDGKHRFMLEEKRVLPMAVRSMESVDHEYLQKIRQFKKDREAEVIETYVKDSALVDEALSDTLQLNSEAELALKSMFTYKGQQKEALQDAKGLIALQKKAQKKEQKQIDNDRKQDAENWQRQQLEYLQSKTDISKYLDKIKQKVPMLQTPGHY
jgi:hypothetical protein